MKTAKTERATEQKPAAQVGTETTSMAHLSESPFDKQLAADAAFAAQFNELESVLRAAANAKLASVERAEQLTQDDFSVYVNARADSSLVGPG